MAVLEVVDPRTDLIEAPSSLGKGHWLVMAPQEATILDLSSLEVKVMCRGMEVPGPWAPGLLDHWRRTKLRAAARAHQGHLAWHLHL